tara:strand:- start:737 stop:1519 length:783 start_codon:yes stop_codon:yes gene_type:complete
MAKERATRKKKATKPCRAKKADGGQCSRTASAGSTYCVGHRCTVHLAKPCPYRRVQGTHLCKKHGGREAIAKNHALKKKTPSTKTKPKTDSKKTRVDTWLKALEERMGRLPGDYKRFVRERDFSRIPGPDGVSFDAMEPTPYGSGVLEFFLDPNPKQMGYFDEVDMLVIGSNGFDYPTCMSLRKGDRGGIYYHDHQQRSLWDDGQFRMMFPNLAPGIEKYLSQRRSGKLPAKPEGLESFYRIAANFSEFLERCEPMESDE